MATYLRVDWGGPSEPQGAVLAGPLDIVAVHHTAGRIPATPDAAIAEVRRIYLEHTSPSSSDPSKPWSDIGYSWLVDAWGNIYEGRGWLRRGAHTPGFNSTAHAIAYVGWGIDPIPTPAVLAIAHCVVAGQHAGAVTARPLFIGHRDALATACPGDGLYSQLPTIRSAVLDFDPSTVPVPEEDIMNAAQDAQLAAVHRDVVDGHLAGGIVAQLDVRLNNIVAKLTSIEERLGAIEGSEMPSPDELVIAAARLIVMGTPQ